MSQRLIIPLGQATGATGGITEKVFNADLLSHAVMVPDGLTDDKIRLYMSTAEKHFVVTAASSAVADSVCNAINDALTASPGGRVVTAQVGNDVASVSDFPV